MATPPNSVVVLTPPGKAAVAVVRLSGPGVDAFVAAHLSRPPAPGELSLRRVVDSAGQTLDHALVCRDGDALELHLHGGRWIVARAVALASEAGFGTVDPSPPLPAASLDGEDELEREAIAHLPLARTLEAAAALLAQPARWRALAARPPDAGQRAAIAADRSLLRLLNPPTVALVGIANAGKSTLANQLFGRDRSITADLPGTTRDWVGEEANLDGLVVHLLDTPGLRDDADALERAALAAASARLAEADLLVAVLDATAPVEPQLRRIPAARDCIRVLNKTDRAPAAAADALQIVATEGIGVEALRRSIRRRFGCDPIDPPRPRWWTPRQLDWLRRPT